MLLLVLLVSVLLCVLLCLLLLLLCEEAVSLEPLFSVTGGGKEGGSNTLFVVVAVLAPSNT